MFFNIGAGVAPRESAGVRISENGAGLRRALLVGTILGAGAIMVAPQAARAQSFNVSSPVSSSDAAVLHLVDSKWGTLGGDVAGQALTITTTATVTSTGNAAIIAMRGSSTTVNNDNMTIDVGADATGLTNGVYVQSWGSGNVTVGGAGAIISTGFSSDSDNPVGEAIYARSASGAVTVAGTGATSAAGVGIRALIDSGTGDIFISRSGAVTSGVNGDAGQDGIVANNAGSGNVTISGIGAITASGTGVSVAAANNGAINIGGTNGLSNAITAGGIGISATSNGVGAIAIKTASGGTVEGTGGAGISTQTVYGATTITVGASVTGSTGINAASTFDDIDIKTAAGATVTATTGAGINTDTDGKTTISADGAVEGVTYGINTRGYSAVSISGSGKVSGAAGINVSAGGGGVQIHGSGATTATAGNAIEVSADISTVLIDRSGAIEASGKGIFVHMGSGGNITIQNVGAVTAGDEGIKATTFEGEITINLNANVESTRAAAIYADSGDGKIIIKTASGVTLKSKSTTSYGIRAISSGSIDIGGTAGLGGDVSGGTGISATMNPNGSGDGSINIKTAAGAQVTGTNGVGIDTSASVGDTTITTGGLVSGTSAGIQSTSTTGKITITTAAGGTVNGTAGNAITTSSVSGLTTIDLGANVSGAGTGALGVSAAASGAGNITIKTAAGVTVTGVAEAIKATSVGGDIRIGDATTGLGGAVSSASFGIKASTSGLGAINIKTAAGAKVESTGATAITTSAGDGQTAISLGGDVSGYSGVGALSGSGGIAITAGSGVSITGKGASGRGISVLSTGEGFVNIGGAAGLSGTVSGVGVGIYASTTGAGAVNVKTVSGGNVTGTAGVGISTTAVNGATTISIGSGSTITGTTYAISATTGSGNVTVTNEGAVNGSINRVAGGAGTSTFNNSGTLTLLGEQANTRFALNNLSGGVLTGTGSFGDVNAASGSIIRPGDRTLDLVDGAPVMGTLNATSLTLASGAIVEIRADYTSGADKIAVTGAAALNGATLKIAATPQVDATWAASKSFTILTASSVTGTFGSTQLDYAFLKATLQYTPISVSITLDRNWTSFGAYSTTPNQKAVSDVFDNFQSSSSNPLISKVTTLTIAQAPVAMSQLSGTGVATTRTQSFAASGLFNGAMNSEMTKFTGSAGGAPLSYADDKKITKAFDKVAAKPAEPILDGRVWAQALGGVANMKSDAANPSERATNFGLAAGVDTALTPNLRAGFALSGGQSTSKVASLATKADAVWGQAALYGVATDGDRYAKAALVYGYLTTETERTVTAFSTPETAKGKFGANLVSTRLEIGQKFATGGPVNLTPFVAFEPSWLMQNGYSETGAATIGLGYGKTTTRALPATLGMKVDADVALDGFRVTPSATLGWVHNFADTSSISPFFTALPGSTFTVAGAKGDRDLARTELNLEATPDGSTATFYANARADLGARTSAVRGTAGAMMRF